MIGSIQGWLLGRAWQIGAAASVAVSLYLGFLLLNEKAETRHLTKVNVNLTAENRDLVADLSQARTNEASLSGALDRQNARLAEISANAAARTAAAEKKVADAQRQSTKAQQRAGAILDHKPQGATTGERMLDVDRKFLETLK